MTKPSEMNAILLVFDNNQIDREHVIETIDKMGATENWFAFFPSAIVIISRYGASEFSRLLQSARRREFRYICTDIERRKRGGWLPRKVWEFINEPECI